MSIPRVLNLSVQRLKYANKQTVKVQAQKSTFVDGETVSYMLPANSVIDLETLGIWMRPSYTTSTTAGGSLPRHYFAQNIRKFEILCNGASLFGGSCSDFASMYVARRSIAQPYFTTLGSDNVYVYPPAIATGSASTTYNSQWFVIDDVMGYLVKNMRFLPTSAFGNVEIRIQLDMKKIADANTSSVYSALGLAETYLLCSTYQFQDNFYENLIAERLSQGPIEVLTENWTSFIGASYTSSTAAPFSIAASSIDYIICTNRNASITSGAGYFDYTCAGLTGTHQLLINGVGVSSFPLALQDVFHQTAFDGCESGCNVLSDIQVGSTSVWQQSRFFLMHKFAFPTSDSYEQDHTSSGLSTFGSVIPMSYNVLGASSLNGATSYTPLIFVLSTATIELGAGKVVSLVN